MGGFLSNDGTAGGKIIDGKMITGFTARRVMGKRLTAGIDLFRTAVSSNNTPSSSASSACSVDPRIPYAVLPSITNDRPVLTGSTGWAGPILMVAEDRPISPHQ